MTTGFRDHMVPRDPFGFQAFPAGNHMVSVQAGEFNYSTPRVTGLPVERYDAFEVAIWPQGDTTGSMCPHDLPFPWVSRFEEHGDGCNAVAGWVPAETVQRIVYDLCDYGKAE